MATRTPGEGISITVGGRTYEFESGQRINIGRDPGQEVQVDNPYVSRQHAVLSNDGGVWVLESVSSNGLEYRGRPETKVAISGPTEVWLGTSSNGERVQIGPKGGGAAATRVAGGGAAATVLPPRGGAPTIVTPGGPLQGSGGGIKVQLGGREYSFPSDRSITIGRLPMAEVRSDNPSVSREHARLRFDQGRWLYESLGQHGTYLDGNPVQQLAITGPTTLRLGDAQGEELQLIPDAGAAATQLPARAAVATPSAGGPPQGAPVPGGAFASGGTGQTSLVRRIASGNRRAMVVSIVAAVVAIAVVVVAVVFFRGGGDDVEGVVADATPKTTYVEAGQFSGTGWVYDAQDGIIVTNAHVTDGATDVKVGISGVGLRGGQVLGEAPCFDLAAIKVSDTQDLESFALAPDDTLAQGQKVVTLGYPGNFSDQPKLQTTDGEISAMGVDWTDGGYPDLIQHTATINHGNSGGPLVDLEGRLVGVNTLTNQEDAQGQPIQDQYYAIPGSRVQEIVPQLVQGMSFGRDGIGPISLATGPISYTDPATGAEKEALTIAELRPDSPVYSEGIRAATVSNGILHGWLLLSVGSGPILTPLDYCDAIGKQERGSELQYVFREYALNTSSGAIQLGPKVTRVITFE